MKQKILERLHAMFMSREQIIYLAYNFVSCIVYGAFSATLSFKDNGLGTRLYSVTLILGCLCSMVYCWVSSDLKKKRWVFKHYKAIDLSESVLLAVGNIAFLIAYFKMGFGLEVDDAIMSKVLWFFFFYNMFWRVLWAIITSVLPGIGNVFKQSLYKNQIDYQNHSNAEGLVSTLGAALGAVASFIIGDFIKYRPWITLLLFITDWVGLWSRWQFYYNRENFAVIKRNFAKDCSEQWRKLKNS